jgi:starch synthase/alpha-amylase
MKILLSQIEDRGIDAAYFWQNLYYENMACEYESTREYIPVDLLTSGVFAAHFVNTVSPTFLMEMIQGQHGFVERPLREELANKCEAGCATGILNAPEPSFNPATDKALSRRYHAQNHIQGKKKNKKVLQKRLKLVQDDSAPLFFWPSRLDSLQKGCRLLAEILYHVVSEYWEQNLEVVFVADGEFQKHFKSIVNFHQINNRVAIRDFDEHLARLAYAASDFVLMPSLFEPCGLPQMIGPLYGSLPVARDTGGIHDTIVHLDMNENRGNGFLFKTFDANGLLWAIRQAMEFYNLPPMLKKKQIERIMTQSATIFNHSVTARRYIDLYEKMLQRPLINAHANNNHRPPAELVV